MFFPLFLSLAAFAYTPEPELIGSPALLANYPEWTADFDRFNDRGTETAAFRSIVEMLYDNDNGRPWGKEFFPEANHRLQNFRSLVCKHTPVKACFTPTVLFFPADIVKLESAILDSKSIEQLSARWKTTISPWGLPLRQRNFSLIIGPQDTPATESAEYWNMKKSDVPWKSIKHILVSDAANYRAGFQNEESAAYFFLDGMKVTLNDWQLRSRAMDFALDWKRTISGNRRSAPSNSIVDARAILLQRLFEEQRPELEKAYEELHVLVSGSHLERFENARHSGDFPEEVYQKVSYTLLRNLVSIQANYLSLAEEQRQETSARQKVLEALLSVQKYSASSTFAVIEILSLMEPLASHAYSLDALSDGPLTQAFVLEQMKALFGMERYEGRALFPAMGKEMISKDLFPEEYIRESAPEVFEALNGRELESLDATEQLRLMKLYLNPEKKKVSVMALYRLGVSFLSHASPADLRKIAELVHEARKVNFK